MWFGQLSQSGRMNFERLLFISALVAASAAYQISNANFYKNFWSTQTRFYWQMVWRMPNITKNTTLIAYEMPYRDYWTGGALTAQVNWTYNPNGTSKNVDYLFVLLNSKQKIVYSKNNS